MVLWNPAKTTRAGFVIGCGPRAYALNELPDEGFDCGPRDTVMSEENFFSLLALFFDGGKENDVLAVLKRSIFFMFGAAALYFRMPMMHDL